MVTNPAANQGRIGGTSLVSGALAPARVEGISAKAFGAPGVELGGAFEALARGFDRAAQQQEAIERSAAFSNMDAVQTDLYTRMDELYRNTEPGTDNYYQTASGMIDNATQEFLATLPDSVKDEFTARANSMGESAKRKAYTEGKVQEDQWFLKNVENANTRAGNGMMTGGWSREEAESYVIERIEATNLPPEEKIKLLQSGRQYISKLDYARSIEAELRAGNVSAETLIRGFESFSANAYLDHKAGTGEPDRYRAGYGSDYVVRADGTRETIKPGTTVSRADAERTLAYRLQNEFQPKVIDQVGSEAWTSLPGSARAGLLSVAWNHGSLPDSVVSAVKSHDLNAIANAVESLPNNPERRQQEADVIRGSVGAYQRAEFANVPTEQDSRGRWFTPNIGYELDGATRDQPLSREYIQTVGGVLRAIDPRLGAVITSAAQPESGADRVGSHRHDVDATGVGHTSDFVLTLNGRKVTPKEAPDLYARAIEEFAAAGMTGIGHYSWGIHVGGGKPAFWGPSTTSADANTTLQAAYNRGRARSNAGIDGDPRFAMVAYEDRAAITQDAQARINAENAAEAKRQKELHDAFMNEKLVDVVKGQYGTSDLDNDIENGTLTQFDDMSKLHDAIKKYQGETASSAVYAERLAGNSYVFDPTSTDDKKGLNAVYGEAGRKVIEDLDTDGFTRQLIPNINRAQMVAPDLEGQLSGLARSMDAKKVKFAMDALAQIEAVSPSAYVRQFDERLRKDVDYFNSHKDVMDQGELVRQMNGGLTPQERSLRAETRKAGESLLGKQNDYNLSQQGILDYFDTRWIKANRVSSGPIFAGDGWMAYQAQKDYQTLFLDAFEQSGNPETAKQSALKLMDSMYGVTDVGGMKQLLKYPPEKVYAPFAGSHDYIAEDVHESMAPLGMQAGDRFGLVSDSQTSDEVRANRANPLAAPMPSYVIIGQDSAGQWKTYTDPATNQPARMRFAVPERMKQEEGARQGYIRAQESARRAVIEADAARQHNELTGTPIPQEILDNETNALKAVEDARAVREAVPQKPVPAPDPMAEPIQVY